MTFTIKQRKLEANKYRDIAEILDPVVAGGGGTVITPGPSGFIGRSYPDQSIWQATPMFEDNFPMLALEKQFLLVYSKWGSYPDYYTTTSKQGVYAPDNLSVVTTEDNLTALNCRLSPKSRYADGKHRGTAANPRFPGKTDGTFSSIKVEQRMRIPKKVAKWHLANMGWPLLDNQWPSPGGETDYVEMNTDSDGVGCFFHVVGGGANGEKQIHFYKTLDITKWFTVGFEFISGKSFRWFVNGQQVVSDNALLTVPGALVPAVPQRLLLQLEDDGSGPTEECNVQYDWFTAWQLKSI